MKKVFKGWMGGRYCIIINDNKKKKIIIEIHLFTDSNDDGMIVMLTRRIIAMRVLMKR